MQLKAMTFRVISVNRGPPLQQLMSWEREERGDETQDGLRYPRTVTWLPQALGGDRAPEVTPWQFAGCVWSGNVFSLARLMFIHLEKYQSLKIKK